jgi:hypothetical protein
MRARLATLSIVALIPLLAVPVSEAAEVRRSAASRVADRDDDRGAARTRPGVIHRDTRQNDDWTHRDDRRRGGGEDRRWSSRGGDRGRSRHVGAFPFLGGGRGLVLQALPRYSHLDARDLERILGRNAFRRLEAESRRAGLRGSQHGVLSTRGRDLRLDISVGNVFVGRLIDRNGDWVIDESRASDHFHRRPGRR